MLDKPLCKMGELFYKQFWIKMENECSILKCGIDLCLILFYVSCIILIIIIVKFGILYK